MLCAIFCEPFRHSGTYCILYIERWIQSHVNYFVWHHCLDFGANMVTKNTTDHNGHISGEITETWCSLCLHCVRCDLNWHYNWDYFSIRKHHRKSFPSKSKGVVAFVMSFIEPAFSLSLSRINFRELVLKYKTPSFFKPVRQLSMSFT